MKKQLIGLAILLCTLLFTYSMVQAAGIVSSGSCGASGDNLTWTLDSVGTLTISGTGDMKNYGDTSNHAPWYESRETIKTIVMVNGVTSMGDFAFDGCTYLNNVTIPDSITNTGICAFRACDNLENVVIPDSITVIGRGTFFRTKVKHVIIPDSVTRIDPCAFQECKNLESIVIPSSVTRIEFWGFYGCTALKDVYYTGSSSQWSRISIEYSNEYLTRAARHYNYIPIEWASKTDSGYYSNSGEDFGMIRFLFLAQLEKPEAKIVEFGIKYSKSEDLSTQFAETVTTDLNALGQLAFYGDIHKIPKNDHIGIYYATAYVKLEDGTVYNSTPISCQPNWDKRYVNYTPKGGTL